MIRLAISLVFSIPFLWVAAQAFAGTSNVSVSGPASTSLNMSETYTASLSPSLDPPFSITWEATGHAPRSFTDIHSVSHQQDYSWSSPGSKTVSAYVMATNGSGMAYTAVNVTGGPSGKIDLDRSRLDFAASNGAVTSPQTFNISNTQTGTLNWMVTDDQSWLTVSPTSGTDSGQVTVSVDTSGLSTGSYSGTVTVSSYDAANSPQTVAVSLTVKNPAQDQPPFGAFATPIDGSNVRSSIPITGWVLDDVEVDTVKIYRGSTPGGGMVYIGDATLVEGARPDIEQAYPDYPNNYKAGWGYMLLTNFLPNGGNGDFTLYAVATDSAGQSVTLGSKTITADNANAVKPFGAIDTPAQGGSASGDNFINWGWALTPLPNTIPTDGSSINVYVDGVRLGNPVYNMYRADIANLFPGYNNSNGAAGHFSFDTTVYANGVHTIAWSVEDNAGNIDGIGSRYFTIQNAGGRSQERSSVKGAAHVDDGRGIQPAQPVSKASNTFNMGSDLMIQIDIAALLGQSGPTFSGFSLKSGAIGPLPVGATLFSDTGMFHWQPGPAVNGDFSFRFFHTDTGNQQTSTDITIIRRHATAGNNTDIPLLPLSAFVLLALGLTAIGVRQLRKGA